MRNGNARFGSMVALGAALALALPLWLPAQAAPYAIVPVDGTTLQGGGPSTWDVSTAALGCNDTGFTPVGDGSWRSKSDAFDNGLVLAINATGFDDADGNGAMTVPDQLVTSNNTAFAPVNVSRTDRALHSSSTLRTLVKFTNTGGTSASLTVEWDSDLGSDSSTEVRASSNGNAVYNLGDRWAVSSDDPTSPSDPVLTFVLFGRNGGIRPDTIVNALGNAQTCFTIDLSMSVPAGATRYLLFFTEMNGRVNAAVNGTAKFDNLAAGDALLTGIKHAILNRIANWSL